MSNEQDLRDLIAGAVTNGAYPLAMATNLAFAMAMTNKDFQNTIQLAGQRKAAVDDIAAAILAEPVVTGINNERT